MNKLATIGTTTLARSNQILQAGLKAFADYISAELNPGELIEAYGTVKETEEVVKSLQDNLRQRTIKQIKQDGVVTSDKGSMTLEVDGMSIEARPHRTGLDAKKVEGLLRAKSVSVDYYMAKIISYAVDEVMLAEALVDGIFTKDELENCKYELNYALQRPKKVSVSDE